MTSEEEFIAWLKDDGNQQPYVLDEGKNKKYVLKVPKAKQFLYLYQQDCYGEQGIERNGSFSYTGFYNKENEMIYDSGTSPRCSGMREADNVCFGRGGFEKGRRLYRNQ